jgi:hypothetical protein
MTIYLHIGTPKTGTTSIQTFLDINTPALARHGIVVPRSLGERNHRRLSLYAMDEHRIDKLRRSKRMLTPDVVRLYREKVLKEFRAEIASFPPASEIVMTSEFMMRLRRKDELERLREFVCLTGQTDIRIVVYLRRQDLYYTSGYSQAIKGGKNIPFSPDGEISEQANYYDRNLQVWAEVFGAGALIVRPFERCSLKNGDAIDDFMAILGVDDLSGLERPRARNESLDANTVEFLRLLNSEVPRRDHGKENFGRMRLIQALETVSTGPRLRMTRQNAERFLRNFEASNQAVARSYLSRETLFEEPVADSPGMEPILTLDDAHRIAATLFENHVLAALSIDRLIEATAWAWNEFMGGNVQSGSLPISESGPPSAAAVLEQA